MQTEKPRRRPRAPTRGVRPRAGVAPIPPPSTWTRIPGWPTEWHETWPGSGMPLTPEMQAAWNAWLTIDPIRQQTPEVLRLSDAMRHLGVLAPMTRPVVM